MSISYEVVILTQFDVVLLPLIYGLSVYAGKCNQHISSNRNLLRVDSDGVECIAKQIMYVILGRCRLSSTARFVGKFFTIQATLL